jgi:peptidoglycan/LPS O-acetylase OafA/YrhL
LRHRDDLQGLRAIAVLLVVLNHAGVPVLEGGYVGVDVFFVLSGFLITGLLLAQAERRGSVSLGEFYVRRARRILPAAVLTLRSAS